MRFVSLCCLLLLAISTAAYAQSSRIVGGTDAKGKAITGYQVGTNPVQWERQEVVPAPTIAPSFLDKRHPYQWSNHAWMGDPFTLPFPAGVYEIRNASIDKTQKVGAWSQPAIVTMKSGAHLYCGGWNLPPLQWESGVVWQGKCISLETPSPRMAVGQVFTLGYGIHHLNGGNTSFSVACEPELMKLAPMLSAYTLNPARLTFGGDYQTESPAPVVVPTSIPNKRFRVAYCFVAETGETALSPPTAWSDPVDVAGWTRAQAVEFSLVIGSHWPQGALGYRVYLQFENDAEPWRRLPASHCHGVPSHDDDYLFQLWDRQPQCLTYYETAPTHTPAVQAKSTLSGLHLALKETGWWPWAPVSVDIVVEVDRISVSCPVHDEWGTSGTGTPFKFGRKIMSSNLKEWIISQSPSGPSKYWPVVHVSNSYSRWWFCSFIGSGASAGVSFDDMAGGQTFGNKFWECKFSPGKAERGGLSYGVIVCERSTAGRGGHTHSEGRYFDCNFTADVPIRLGGNQTANINFSDTLSSCTTGKGRRTTALWLICPNEVRFRGLWGADSFGGPVVFISGFNAKLNCDHLWKDQLSSAIFECQTGCGLDVQIRAGKLNMWSTAGWEPTLARFAHSGTASRISLTGMQSQYSYWPTTADVLSPRPNMVEMIFEKTGLDSQVALVEPNYEQWNKEWKATYYADAPQPPPLPGMRVVIPPQTIPAQTVPIVISQAAGNANIEATATIPAQTLPSQTVVFNSLTGQQQVTRRPWK